MDLDWTGSFPLNPIHTLALDGHDITDEESGSSQATASRGSRRIVGLKRYVVDGRGLRLAAIPMAGCSPWLTGRTGWNKSLESGYGYGHGYTILWRYIFMRIVN